ncbi:MAG: sodium:solute symporter family protein [Phycisphaeraceae bacterium]|nr:sodium:solute symporter family protein [Phycisphaeraceae bacterium]
MLPALGQAVGLIDILVVLLYLLVTVFLGWLGFRRTTTAADYLLAGRQVHPFVMALSYGATFISTSAIVGFGGVAAMFGMSLLWLTFCNIFVGIFIAFIFLGGPTRKMGHHLDAHTFGELLGRRYQSRTLQGLVGLIIFVFMPLYAAAVLIGGAEFVAAQFNVDYTVALLVFSVLVAVYVVSGGMKGLMYTEAFQAIVMVVGMLVLLVGTYAILGGVTPAHHALTGMNDQVFPGFRAIGHRGFTAMPQFGWGDMKYNLWWIVVSTIILGVGIGVLAQPQLAVRFMTVSSKRQLNRAVAIGAFFILVVPGVAFTVGALSNVYFHQHEVIRGRLINETPSADVVVKRDHTGVKTVPCRLIHLDTTGDGHANVDLIAEGLGPAAKIMPHANIVNLSDGKVEVRPAATSFTRSLVHTARGWELNPDSIIPLFITSAMPNWFGMVFLLTLLAAAMSTLASQFHAQGAALSRDCIGAMRPNRPHGIFATRMAIIVGIILAVALAHHLRGGYIIARATAIFFGLCAAAFLPAFIGGLFFRRMTPAAAISSLIVGALVSTAWIVLVKLPESAMFGLAQKCSGKASLLLDHPNWPVVDPIVIALPISLLTAIVVSCLTRPCAKDHLDRCFRQSV